jgi:hypothetical protein
VVVRQTLIGSDYGLLDDRTLEPRPDYWASVLWKRVMGSKVLATTVQGDTLLRMYAHCAAHAPPGAVALAIVNLDRSREAEVRLPFPSDDAELYVLGAPALTSSELEVNGVRPSGIGSLVPTTNVRPLRVPPLSAAFVVLPFANAPACIAPTKR